MQRSKFLLYSFLFISVFSLSTCNDDDMGPEEPVELITTLLYTLTPDGGGTPVVLSFRDTDGDGGNAPVVTTEPLAAGTTYTASVSLLNESETPAEDISEEVSEEAEEHQFFFSATGADLTVSYADQDADGNPIGLVSEVVTGTAGSGSLTITLRHQPDKNADGVSNGLIANAGGETDIEVTFSIEIE